MKNINQVLTGFFLLLCVSCASSGTVNKKKLVEWNHAEAKKRLERSKHKVDFFDLANNFESQANKIYCGVASSVIILNTLKLRTDDNLPIDQSSVSTFEKKYMSKKANPYFSKFTQRNVLNKESKQKIEILGKPILINGKLKKDFGLQLRQLAKIIETNGANVKIRVVDDELSHQKIRSELINNLKSNGDYVLVNYSRKVLGQPGGGHISPVGAYDEGSDSFLVMDVNPNKAPWVWVKSGLLIDAMKTFDTLENRGYLLVSDSNKTH